VKPVPFIDSTAVSDGPPKAVPAQSSNGPKK